MKIKNIIFFVILFCSQVLIGQTIQTIHGFVIDGKTKLPLPFANVYNQSLKKGTISNYDGYFKLIALPQNDTITVSYVGFKKKLIVTSLKDTTYLIALEENTQLLDEITIITSVDNFLYDLVDNCNKNASEYITDAKAYYDLKSYNDTTQIELIEGFYNVRILGGDIESLKLKAGRYALKPQDGSFFTSLSSSQAITMLKLSNKSEYFPYSPFNLTKKETKKEFKLHLNKKYTLDNNDTIYLIDYFPINKSELYFKGKIWINKSQTKFIKINLECDSCKQHPFIPINEFDSIANVSLRINKTFHDYKKHTIFGHIDFDYTIDYKRRPGKADEKRYSITSKAILYAYDFSKTFNLPKFEFKNPYTNDYRKINAMPYNSFFWKYNNEYRTNDVNSENENYFSSLYHLTNQTLPKVSQHLRVNFQEQAFHTWSETRLALQESAPDTLDANQDNRYQMAIKIFADYNRYNDSINIVTSTIFDPYETYFNGTIDNTTNCYFNTYFDLCEIERLKLQKKLNKKKLSFEEYDDITTNFLYGFEQFKYNYELSTLRGNNLKGLYKWNKVVINYFGIDNFQNFMLYNDLYNIQEKK